MEYPPYLRVKPFQFGALMLLDKGFYNTNYSEFLEAILNSHVEDMVVMDMYLGDAIYVYNYLLATSFNLQEFKTTRECPHCQTINDAVVPIADFEIRWLTPETSIQKKIEIDDCVVSYRRRKVKDNFVTAILQIQKDNVSDVERVANFLAPQITEIIQKSSQGDKVYSGLSITKEFLLSLTLNKLLNIYEEMLEEDLGYENRFVMTCRNCKNKSDFRMWDARYLSVFSPSEDKDISAQFEQIFTLTQSKNLRMSEIWTIPYIAFEDMINGLQKSLPKQGK